MGRTTSGSARLLLSLTLGCVLVPLGVGGASATSPASAAPAARRSSPHVRTVPAYVDATRLEARIPRGDLVSYRLAKLPTGGTRVMGDWDGDGAETPGTFAAGQWRFSDTLVRPRAADVTGSFGQAGDVPVVGDWNGDGLTDVGVRRGSTWLLALSPLPANGPAPVWKRLTFGKRGGVPVVGDWNGSGRDSIGVVHGRHWVLARSLARPTSVRTALYGRPGDEPVTGDWDGDGRDGIGVVRGRRWYLSNHLGKPTADITSTLKRAADDVPVTWRVPLVSGSASCPTRADAPRGNAGLMVPSTLLNRSVTNPDQTTRQVRGSLQTAERYLLGDQYDALWRSTRTHSYLSLLGGKSDELAIRLPAMSALTVAIGLRTGAADPKQIGRPDSDAVAYVSQLVRSIACEHESVSPGGWGLGWETAHWAMLTGAAAWLVWDRLTAQTRSDVVAMLTAEADRQTQLAIPYWALPDGTVLTPGNTRAEECAWNSGLLSLAAAMLPSAPHADLWRDKAADLAVAAYSTPDDVTSSTVVNGVPLDERLQGYNAYADGTVENHQRIHPDYAANIQLLWLSADFDRLAGRSVPEAMFHNAGLVYSSLSTHVFQAGTLGPNGVAYQPPGGTVYVPGTNQVYYPQGDDWGVVRRAHFVSLDAHALAYAPYLDATGWPAGEALTQHERGQRALVASSGTDDGRTYSIDPVKAAQQDTYPGREEYAAQSMAVAWLALYIRQIGLPPLDRSTLTMPGSSSRAPAVTSAPAGAEGP